MKNHNLYLTFTLLLIALTSFGQAGIPDKEEVPYIEVTGFAEKEIIPDEIYIRIIIKERSSGKDKITIDEQEEKMKAAIRSLGIDLQNLSLADANADYVRVHWGKKEVLTQKDYTLKVSNATALGQVFQELDKLEITDAYISKVDHSQIKDLKKEVKIEAIKSAKEKADYLLIAIGEQTGKPLEIKEVEVNRTYGIEPRELNVRGSRSDGTAYYVDGTKDKSEAVQEIQFQKIKIQSNIYVKFRIK
jgi:hypothetical protein